MKCGCFCTEKVIRDIWLIITAKIEGLRNDVTAIEDSMFRGEAKHLKHNSKGWSFGNLMSNKLIRNLDTKNSD